MKSDLIRSFSNASGLALVLAVNYLANALPLNGKTTDQFTDQYNVLYTPAGYVFSFWGLIYTLLSVWVICQLPPKHSGHAVFRRIAIAFYFTARNRDVFYSFVFVWAFIGIAVKRTELQDIWLSALLVAGVLAIHVLCRLFSGNFSCKQRT